MEYAPYGMHGWEGEGEIYSLRCQAMPRLLACHHLCLLIHNKKTANGVVSALCMHAVNPCMDLHGLTSADFCYSTAPRARVRLARACRVRLNGVTIGGEVR